MPANPHSRLPSGQVQFMSRKRGADVQRDDSPFWAQSGKFPVIRVRFYWSEVVHIKDETIPDTETAIELKTEEDIIGSGLYTPPPLRLQPSSRLDVASELARDQLAYIFRAYPVRSLRIVSSLDGEMELPEGISPELQYNHVTSLLKEFYVRPTLRIGVYSVVKNPSSYKHTPGSRGVGPSGTDPFWARKSFEVKS